MPTGWSWSRRASTCSTWGRWRRTAARRLPPEVEAAALVPAIEGLATAGVPVSADTFSVEVARSSAGGGGGCGQRHLRRHARRCSSWSPRRGCGYVLMHIEGPPRVDRAPARLRRRGRAPEVVVRGESRGSLKALGSRGADRDRPRTRLRPHHRAGPGDPAAPARAGALGLPLYVSLSRKDFIGAVLAGSWEGRLPPGEREWGTVAAVALAVRGGADILRIHDRSSLAGDARRGPDRGLG